MLNKQLSVAGNLEIHEKVNTYKYIYLDTHMSKYRGFFLASHVVLPKCNSFCFGCLTPRQLSFHLHFQGWL